MATFQNGQTRGLSGDFFIAAQTDIPVSARARQPVAVTFSDRAYRQFHRELDQREGSTYLASSASRQLRAKCKEKELSLSTFGGCNERSVCESR
jgi:hypothetical protein